MSQDPLEWRPVVEAFTRRARASFERAESVAGRLGHDSVRAAHVLLALLGPAPSRARQMLDAWGHDRVEVADALREELTSHDEPPERMEVPPLPLSDSTRRLLGEAIVASSTLRHDHLGTEHLLLGMNHDSGRVGEVVRSLGVTSSMVDGWVRVRPPLGRRRKISATQRIELLRRLRFSTSG